MDGWGLLHDTSSESEFAASRRRPHYSDAARAAIWTACSKILPAPLQLRPLDGIGAQLDRRLVGARGALSIAGALEQLGMGGVEGLVALERGIVQQRREQIEACLWAVGEADGDGTVELDYRGWCELHERAEEVGDLPPVGLLLDLERRDRRLQLVLTGAPQTHGTLQRPKALADARLVPPRAVLLADRKVAAVLVDARDAPRVMQEHQREQSPYLGVVGHQLAQQQAEPDRLVAQLLAYETVALGRGIALVEDQIHHAEHPAHPIRDLGVARHLVRDPRVGDLPLGPDDALPHRRLGNQERARDLAGREATERT